MNSQGGPQRSPSCKTRTRPSWRSTGPSISRTVRQLENWIWEHFDARHHYLRHLAPDQFGDFTDGVMRKHHSDPLALVQLLLVHRILSARKSMLLKVPLSVHEEIVHAHELRGEAAHDHEHV